MKKEFMTPVVETKAFNSPEDIMVGVLLTSAGQANKDLASITDETVDGFKQWKGFKEN